MKESVSKNLLSSIVIFLVAIPLNLGIALASGVEPAAGLIAGLVAGLVVGTLAGCPLQVSGPAAGLIAIVWQIIDAHGLAMLGPVVLAAGLLQIAVGASRLAPWFRAVCPSVIQGMLAGIGVLIFASQLQVMLDQKPQVSGLANLLAVPAAIWEVLVHGSGHPSALIGLGTIAAIVAWGWAPKSWRVVPGSLIGVLLAIAAAALFHPAIRYVAIPADPLSSLSGPGLEQLGGLLSPSVLGSVLALAFVATAQTLLTATAVDRLHDGPKTDYNREVIAQGCGNALCGLLGALPISGVIVRSAANVEAGATGRLSSVLHGLWLGLFVLFLSPLLTVVPLPALAAVLVYTGLRLINLRAAKEIYKFGGGSLAVYLVTLVTVVAVNLLTGILVGFAASAARLIYVLTHCSIRSWEHESGALVVELRGSATFFTLPSLADRLSSLPPGREVHLFLSGLNHIDHACLEHLLGWEEAYLAKGGEVFVEWDHLVARFHRPLTADLGSQSTFRPARRERESFDRLASRARLIELDHHYGWAELAGSLSDRLSPSVPEAQRRMIREGLDEQFRGQSFPVVRAVGLPHLMVPGMSGPELLVVKTTTPLRTLDPTEADLRLLVILLGPPSFAGHTSLLAELSERAEEGLAGELLGAESQAETRQALLHHRRYLTLRVESEGPTAELAGKALWQLTSLWPAGTLVAQIERQSKCFVPGGASVVQTGDHLLILGEDAAIDSLFDRFVRERVPV